MSNILLENNNERTTRQKLIDLINNPATLPHIATLAKEKLTIYQETDIINKVISTYKEDLEIKCNVEQKDFSAPYIGGLQIGEIYKCLTNLSPKPYVIEFGRDGTVKFRVKGPFFVTKQMYSSMLTTQIQSIKTIYFHPYEGDDYGYCLTLSFVK